VKGWLVGDGEGGREGGGRYFLWLFSWDEVRWGELV
jgi:hypothetical protein